MGKEIRFKNPKAPGTFKQLKAAACHLRDVLAEDLKLDLKESLDRKNRYQLQGVVYTILKKRLFKPDNKTYVKDPLTMAEMDLFVTCKTFPPYLLMEVKKGMKDKYGWIRHDWYPREKVLEEIKAPKKEKVVRGPRPTVMTHDQFLQIYGHKAVAARLEETKTQAKVEAKQRGNGLYKIEKNIPIPKQQGRRAVGNHVEIAAQMNVGDSVLLSSEEETNRLCSLMNFRKRKTCRRKQENGKSWRVWRTT
jgi:hypothetical protein